MAKIIMVQSMAGCIDGIHQRKYQAGQEYEIDGVQMNQKLANIFLKCGAAKMADIVPPNPPNPPKPNEPIDPPEKAVVENPPEMKEEDPVDDENAGDEQEPEEEKKESEPEAKIMRVFELANELKVPYKRVVKVAKTLKINVEFAQAGLTQSEADKIKAEFIKQ